MRKFQNAHGVAASMGFPYIRGEGKTIGGSWYSSFSKNPEGTGERLFVGFVNGQWRTRRTKTRRSR